MRRVRALSHATLLAALTLTAPAARAEAAQSGGWTTAGEAACPDLESWWAEPGGPAQTPDAWLGVPFPWTLAGLTLGGWRLGTAGRAPRALPWPGVDAARRPIAWYDSVAVAVPGGAWGGPDGVLMEVRGLRRPTGERRARAIFSLESGDFGTDAYGLAFERGDSLRWLGAETASGRRGAMGALGLAGAHVWGVSGGLARGRHRWRGSYMQCGFANELRDALASEAAAGESGEFAWDYHGGRSSVALRLERGHDHHESFDNSFGAVLPYSRREGQENRAVLESARTARAGTLLSRLEWRESSVRRSADPQFSGHSTTWWGALGFERPAGDGRVRLELGGGRSSGVRRSALAPRVLYDFGAGGLAGRLFATRLVVPVWSDLAPGQAPFLQSTWAGGFEVTARGTGGLRGDASLMVGVTRDRALLVRYPLEDVWLRVGATSDPSRYGFGLAMLRADWRAPRVGAGASGYLLWRDVSALQPRVDPGAGMHAYAETRFALFQNDLAMAVRAEGAGVAAREGEFTTRRLPPYLTAGASLGLTLVDVSLTLRARNLENRRREEVWIDPTTGIEALGPGREVRLALSWKLFD